VKKDFALIGGLFLVIVVLLVFGQGFTSVGFLKTKPGTETLSSSISAKTVKIGSVAFNVEIADTQDERRKGLSNRESLPLENGMLFVFEKSGKYSIWMKNMEFAIDIIWIDKNKKIVDIAQNVSPEPKKKDSDLAIYTPSSEAKYVLEINAGLVSLNNIQTGDVVEF